MLLDMQKPSRPFDHADKDRSYWKVDMGISNPDAQSVSLKRMHLSLLHEGITLASKWTSSRKDLVPGTSQAIQGTPELPNEAIKGLPSPVLRDPDARFLLVGDAVFRTRLGKVGIRHGPEYVIAHGLA